jgi:hypothetical protein
MNRKRGIAEVHVQCARRKGKEIEKPACEMDGNRNGVGVCLKRHLLDVVGYLVELHGIELRDYRRTSEKQILFLYSMQMMNRVRAECACCIPPSAVPTVSG